MSSASAAALTALYRQPAATPAPRQGGDADGDNDGSVRAAPPAGTGTKVDTSA